MSIYGRPNIRRTDQKPKAGGLMIGVGLRQ
jgi:hypothetical protein